MALNNNYDFYMKIVRKAGLLLAVIFLVIFNGVKLCHYTAANPEKIIHYQIPKDELAQFRHPLISAVFVKSNLEGDAPPVLLIVPPINSEKNQEFITKALAVLKKAPIKNVIVLKENKALPFKGIVLPSESGKKESANRIYRAEKIQQQLAQKEKINVIHQSYKTDKALSMTVDSLLDILPDAKIAPIVYGGIAPKNLKEALLADAKSSETAIVLIEDAENIDSIGIVAFQTIAQQLNFSLKISDLLENSAANAVFHKKQVPQKFSVAQQQQNLKQFKQNHEDIIKKWLPDAEKDYKKPEYNEETKHLFDKASVAVVAQNKQTNASQEYANLGFSKPFFQIALDGLRALNNKVPNAKIRIFLLTEMVAKSYQTEALFLADISPNQDGILLVNGYRKGMMLPYLWQEYPNKKEFIKHLKIKSGLSPDYWSEQIMIYYFKAVEITDDKN